MADLLVRFIISSIIFILSSTLDGDVGSSLTPLLSTFGSISSICCLIASFCCLLSSSGSLFTFGINCCCCCCCCMSFRLLYISMLVLFLLADSLSLLLSVRGIVDCDLAPNLGTASSRSANESDGSSFLSDLCTICWK